MIAFYNVFIRLYGFAIWLYSFVNEKAKLWIVGRKNWHKNLINNIPNGANVVWIHCASLGEFEQGRTVIESIKKQNNQQFILLTFYSPSGYEIRKNYEYANYVCYLPLDTKNNAKQFLEIVKPSVAIFVKYEFWFNILDELYVRNIKIIFISAIFRENHYLFTWYGKVFLEKLKKLNHLFLQDENSYQLLKKNSFANITIAGDTRFDRVFELANNTVEDEIVKQFTLNSATIILGSSWVQDENILFEIMPHLQNLNLKIIIAPHEVDAQNIDRILLQCKNYNPICYTKYKQENSSQILIIDCIGKLMQIYKYGTMAFVGGGFGKGIHNILEPATFGLPIAFGPNYKNFNEAVELEKLSVAFCINNETDLLNFIKHFLPKTEEYNNVSGIAINYVSSKCGATKQILNYLFENK